ncbi:MAG: DUF3368 domain-containing protein [Anaerolineae bacterium]|nr:DUF3368 domain-containing protein [Anaerolineae bacterium]
MNIVSNASPLINLSRIDQLTLLQRLYGELLIPDAVWQEVVVEGIGQPGAKQVEDADWIHVRTAANRPLIRALERDLDAGEAEAIALASEVGAGFLLIDERLGREAALHLGVTCIGLIGVLVDAKRRGLVDQIKPMLDALRDIAGFWISESLYRRILLDERESPG